jgi:hypothetical protein
MLASVLHSTEDEIVTTQRLVIQVICKPFLQAKLYDSYCSGRLLALNRFFLLSCLVCLCRLLNENRSKWNLRKHKQTLVTPPYRPRRLWHESEKITIVWFRISRQNLGLEVTWVKWTPEKILPATFYCRITKIGCCGKTNIPVLEIHVHCLYFNMLN